MPPIYQGRGPLIKMPSADNFIIQWDKHIDSALNNALVIQSKMEDSRYKARQLEYMKLKEQAAQEDLEMMKEKRRAIHEERIDALKAKEFHAVFGNRFQTAIATGQFEDAAQIYSDMQTHEYYNVPGVMTPYNKSLMELMNNDNIRYKDENGEPIAVSEAISSAFSKHIEGMQEQATLRERRLGEAEILHDVEAIEEGETEEDEALRKAYRNTGFKLGILNNATSYRNAINTMDMTEKTAILEAENKHREAGLVKIKQSADKLSTNINIKTLEDAYTNIDKFLKTHSIQRETDLYKAELENNLARKAGEEFRKEYVDITDKYLAPWEAAAQASANVVTSLYAKLNDPSTSEKDRMMYQDQLDDATKQSETAASTLAKMRSSLPKEGLKREASTEKITEAEIVDGDVFVVDPETGQKRKVDASKLTDAEWAQIGISKSEWENAPRPDPIDAARKRGVERYKQEQDIINQEEESNRIREEERRAYGKLQGKYIKRRRGKRWYNVFSKGKLFNR